MLIFQASKRYLKFVLYMVLILYRNGIRHKSLNKMTTGYLGLSAKLQSSFSLAS
jgi:hypothetical protein